MPMDVAQQGYVQARVEERVKSGSDINAAETELNPLVRYDLIWRGGQNHFVAIYNPRFIHTTSWDRTLPDPNLINPETLNLADPNATPLSALHNGGVGYEVVRPRWRLSLYQFLAYGPISTTALLVQAPWNGVALPPDPNPIIPAIIGARFRLLFVQTQLFVPIKLSERTALIPGATYNAFGGADRSSRGVIALTQGPGASLALDHAATRSDRLISSVGAGRVTTTFQDDREGVVIIRTEATQTWRHYYSNNLSSEVMGGAAIGGDQINGFTMFTLGHAALLWDSWGQARIPPGAAPYGVFGGRGRRLQLGAVAKVQPWIDLFSGDLEQRAVVSLAANYSIDRVTVRGALSHARVLATPRSVAEYQIVLGDAGIQYRITPTFSVDAGLRAGYQDFNNAVRFNELTQLTVYGGLSWVPLPARF
ncbi:MAG: hypothetical protein KF764_02465 [Labilithrix sp.]|nr:hypothetical protein [Labilithrix sp.]MBX3220768.1 hypothetical protein [Labilithrix sp.]